MRTRWEKEWGSGFLGRLSTESLLRRQNGHNKRPMTGLALLLRDRKGTVKTCEVKHPSELWGEYSPSCNHPPNKIVCNHSGSLVPDLKVTSTYIFLCMPLHQGAAGHVAQKSWRQREIQVDGERGIMG